MDGIVSVFMEMVQLYHNVTSGDNRWNGATWWTVPPPLAENYNDTEKLIFDFRWPFALIILLELFGSLPIEHIVLCITSLNWPVKKNCLNICTVHCVWFLPHIILHIISHIILWNNEYLQLLGCFLSHKSRVKINWSGENKIPTLVSKVTAPHVSACSSVGNHLASVLYWQQPAELLLQTEMHWSVTHLKHTVARNPL